MIQFAQSQKQPGSCQRPSPINFLVKKFVGVPLTLPPHNFLFVTEVKPWLE